ncbi:hypothetical protein ACFL3W_01475 [Pseudomonadota bacterium]
MEATSTRKEEGMTIPLMEKVQCAFCGADTEHTSILSTIAFVPPDLDKRPSGLKRSSMLAWVQSTFCGVDNEYTSILKNAIAFGPRNLDTRPSGLERSTISAWVQRCPECGYCASMISKAPAVQAVNIIYGFEYTRQLIDETYPEVANNFLCKSLIDEASSNYAAAVWALIHAAWVCDDVKKTKPARTCRIKAADMITKAIENGQKVGDRDGAETVIQADLLRRAGRVAEARTVITDKRSSITEGNVSKILDFQDALLSRGDEACHTIEEVPNLQHPLAIINEPSLGCEICNALPKPGTSWSDLPFDRGRFIFESTRWDFRLCNCVHCAQYWLETVFETNWMDGPEKLWTSYTPLSESEVAAINKNYPQTILGGYPHQLTTFFYRRRTLVKDPDEVYHFCKWSDDPEQLSYFGHPQLSLIEM